MKTDTLFYRLFLRQPKLALELLGLDYPNDSYQFSSEEIKQTAFRIDGLFKPVSDNPNQPLIFVEVLIQSLSLVNEDVDLFFISKTCLAVWPLCSSVYQSKQKIWVTVKYGQYQKLKQAERYHSHVRQTGQHIHLHVLLKIG